MRSRGEDLPNYDEFYPSGLIPINGTMPLSEFTQPNYVNKRGEKATPVFKNGLGTGTTVGGLNPLPSFVRFAPEHGMESGNVSLATGVLPFGKSNNGFARCNGSTKRVSSRSFSEQGDSGALILNGGGRIVALLIAGAGSSEGTDITYGTPYCEVEQQIKEAYPGYRPYPTSA